MGLSGSTTASRSASAMCLRTHSAASSACSSATLTNLSCPLQTLNREGQQEADDLQFKAPGRHGMDLPGKHRAQLAEDRLDILANRLAQKFHPSWHLSLGSLPALGFQM